jgi:hypothetical protein
MKRRGKEEVNNGRQGKQESVQEAVVNNKDEAMRLYNVLMAGKAHMQIYWCPDVDCDDCTASASGGCLRDNLNDVMQVIADKQTEENK